MVRGLLLTLLSAVCFGSSPIIYKLGFASGLKPLELLQYRFTFAALFILLYLLATRPGLVRAGRATLLRAAFTGVALYLLQSWAFLTSLRYIPAATTSLILYFYPVVVNLAAAMIFRQRPDRLAVLALVVIMGGIGFVSYDAFDRALDPIGVVFAVLAMLVFSTYMLVNQVFMRTEKPLTFTLYVLTATAVAYTAIGSPLAILAMSGRQILICVLCGLVPTALAVPLLYLGIERIGSACASIASTVEPVVTLTLAWLLLGEAVNVYQIAGMVLIITGICLPNLAVLRLHRAVAAGGRA